MEKDTPNHSEIEYYERMAAAGRIGRVSTESIRPDGTIHRRISFVPRVSLVDIAEVQDALIDEK